MVIILTHMSRKQLSDVDAADRIGAFDPQPQKFGKLAFLMKFSQSYISLNWLSGVLVWGSGVPIPSAKVSSLSFMLHNSKLQRVS